MTALTQDRNTQRADGLTLPFPVITNDCLYGGGLIAVNATGYALPGSDTAGLIFQGVAEERADNTGGANGAIDIVLRRRGVFLVDVGHAITQANVGDNVFLVDDQTVDLVANVTHAIFCGIIVGVYSSTKAWIDITPAIQQADVATHIADTSGAHAASAISIADAGGYTSQTEVEGALQEIYPTCPVTITDPGNAGAIPVTRSGNVAITTTGAQTRTLAIPGVAGIELALSMDVDGGDCVITVASAINQTGNNTITLNDAGDTVVLKAVKKAGALVWRVVVNDGASLTTV